MFEQRIHTKASDQYYFQLIPNYLNIKTSALVQSLKTANKSFRLKLIKGLKVSDQCKKATLGKPISGKIPFQKTQLNFYLASYNPNRNIEYILIICECDNSSDKQQEIGKFTLMSGDYITQFRDHKTRLFHQTIDFNQDYSLNFDLFVNDNRYALQKFIRETRELRKQETRNDVVKKQSDKEKQGQMVSRTKSEVNSESSRGQIIAGQNRFMSPSRRIVRKNVNQKKLIMRNSSPTRSQRSDGGSQSSGRSRDLKFLSGRDGGISPKTERKSLAQQQAQKVDKRKQDEEKKKRILEEDAKATREIQKKREIEQRKRKQQKKIEEQRRMSESKRRKQELQEKKGVKETAKQEQRKKIQSRLRYETNQLQTNGQNMKKKEASRVHKSFTNPDIHIDNNSSGNTTNMKSKKSYETEDLLMMTHNNRKNSQDWAEPLKIKRTESITSIDPTTLIATVAPADLKTTAYYLGFLIISLFLIYNAMTPSSKV